MQNHDEFALNTIDLLQDLVAKAIKAGADEADAVMGQSISVSHQQRMGKTEGVDRSESSQLGLRVIIAKKQALVSSNDFTLEGQKNLIERVIAMAKSVPEDPWCGLADAKDLAKPSLAYDPDSEDREVPSQETLIERAKIAEDTALQQKGITNSEGSSASWEQSRVALVNSYGFKGARSSTNHGISVQIIAGEGLEMEVDYDYSSTVYGEDLEDPATIGESAAKRALARLHPKRPPSGNVPIIFDRRVASSLLGSLGGAINGQSIAKKTSFLLEDMGKAIFPKEITISDNPLLVRGLSSRKFDGEGIATQSRNFIENGILTSWVLDQRSARQLGLKSTGNGGRGSPSLTNFTLHKGSKSVQDLMKDEPKLFLVTHLMGMGVNGLTGDYSQGASGFWVEKGEIVHAVNEATIAGNLKDMFKNLTAADDLIFKGSYNSPSLRIDGMTMAAAG